MSIEFHGFRYYKSHQGFNKEYPSSIIREKEELAKKGMPDLKGMGPMDIYSIFKIKGFTAIYWDMHALKNGFSRITPEKLLIRKIQPYLVSGIPCILLVKPQNDDSFHGHAVTGIGIIEDFSVDYEDLSLDKYRWKTSDYYTINTADYCNEIIVIDDISCVSCIGNNSGPYYLQGAIVPVPNTIKLRADDAYTMAVFAIGILPIEEKTFFVSVRLIQATEYIRYRIDNAKNTIEKIMYAEMLLPKYLWVCEISSSYCTSNDIVDGEIILDAMNEYSDIEKAIIFIRYKNIYMLNGIEQVEEMGREFIKVENLSTEIKRYIGDNIFSFPK